MLARNPAANSSGRVVVLLFHSVSDTAPHASATPLAFREQLAWLQEACEVVPFERILDRANGDHSGRPVVAITFDDGYADNYEHAWPALVEYKLPATFFISTGLIDGWASVNQRFMRLQDAQATDVAGMSWSQIKEMHASGMTFGAHTVSHANLARLDDDTVRWEIGESKDRLDDQLSMATNCFAYPFGKPKHHYTPRTVELVREAGFDIAAAVNDRGLRSTEDAFRIPRMSVNQDDLATLQAKVAGRFDPLGLWQERAPQWLSHLVSPANSHRDVASLRHVPNS